MIGTELSKIVGPEHVLFRDQIDERYRVDLTGAHRSAPLCVVRPGSTCEIAETVKIAGARNVPIVPFGGNTGITGGTVANRAIKLSLERLNVIHDIDPLAMTMTVGAGVTLEAVQTVAAANGLFFPLDFGSRGSATIGGVLATNAGGSRVLRWGMARDMTLGLEAVLPDGSVVASLGKMLKDNAGYDWKQLLIGAEGTLGIITQAVLRLRPAPASCQTALLAVANVETALRALRHLEARLGGRLSSFELMWNDFYRHVTTANISKRAPPMPATYGLYCLIEALGSDRESDDAAFIAALGDLLSGEIVEDAVVAQSERERENIWAVREDLINVVGALKPFVAFDVSLSQRSMAAFKNAAQEAIVKLCPSAMSVFYGHGGDGNLHMLVSDREATDGFQAMMEDTVFRVLESFGGSISGEHGIGIAKVRHLGRTRSEQEIKLMKLIKTAIDPHNIMNPGKVLGIYAERPNHNGQIIKHMGSEQCS